MTESENIAYIKAHLSDKWWRMNNLYKIENEVAELVQFKLRPAQEFLFKNMWWLNDILKARQLGFSTAIDIYLLDEALFNKNLKCGIIAQDQKAAQLPADAGFVLGHRAGTGGERGFVLCCHGGGVGL